MKTRLTTLLLLLICLLSGKSYAQNFDKTQLDAYFDLLTENDKMMGTVAILKDGQELYSRSIGYANFDYDKENSIDTEFRLGSISKTVTAILVMQAVEQGKLKLDEKLAAYYPDVPNADKITISMLLHHRSGLHSFTDDEDYLSYNTKGKTEAELLKMISQGEVRFQPDEKFSYSNSNYVLLTFILQKAYKKSYGELVEKGIVKPLKLKHTYFGNAAKSNPYVSKSYVYDNENWTWNEETVTDMSIPLGAGGIVSTAIETAKLFDALFNGMLISESSLASMTEMKDGYGKGIYQLPFNDKKGFGHNGSIDGYNTSAAYFKDGRHAISILCNGVNYSINDVAIKMLSACYGVPFELPSFTSYDTKPGELKVFTGTYYSKQLPLELNVTDENDQLIIQATGQSAIPMNRAEQFKFTFDQAGIVIVFDPAANSATLFQGGGEFLFTLKEE